ncbi:MAG: hypothetical protein ACREL3_00600 [Gemmatimonadales bacterium]
MATARPISFHATELHEQPSASFLTGLVSESDRLVAQALVKWAVATGLRFRHSRKDGGGVVEYLVVPATAYSKGKLGEPLLTLQQTKGVWDIPFRRMRGLALGAQVDQQRLLDALNGALPAGQKLKQKGLKNTKGGGSWSQLPYAALEEPQVRRRVCELLRWAAQGMKQGTLGPMPSATAA